MVLGALSAGSVLLTRRYRLLQTRSTGHGRYDAMTAAMLPKQPGQPPLNLGLILVLSAMGVWVLSMMAALVRFSLAAQGDPTFEPTLGLSAQAYGASAGTAILIVGLACVFWRPLASVLGLPLNRREFARDLLLSGAAFALAIPLILLTGMVVGIIMALLAQAGVVDPADPLAHETLRDLDESERSGAWWAVIAMVVIAVPIGEELIYRGLMQSGVRANLGTIPSRRRAWLDWIAIGIVSMLFTYAHQGVAAPHALAVIIVLSIAMGLAYERTGRLLVPIGMHIGFNALNIVISQFST